MLVSFGAFDTVARKCGLVLKKLSRGERELVSPTSGMEFPADKPFDFF
jgi:hypothetical protein